MNNPDKKDWVLSVVGLIGSVGLQFMLVNDGYITVKQSLIDWAVGLILISATLGFLKIGVVKGWIS